MAVNYTIKYSERIAEIFTHASFVKPHTNGQISFEGAKTVRVYNLDTVPVGDYKREGSNRYGTPTDVQDTVLEYTMTQDKAWTAVVDRGDESDQAMSRKMGAFIKKQTRAVVVPESDKYALRRFLKFGKSITVSAAPTKTTVIDQFVELQAAFDNALVPDTQRVVFVPVSVFKLIAVCDEFIKLEALGVKSVAKGQVGELFGFKIIKVPDGMLPADCYALAIYTPSIAMPYKLDTLKVHTDPVGYSGSVVESRQYYDAFVLGEKVDGVVGLVLTGKKLAAPTITATTKTATTITCSSASEIKYTLDGSDPRFSMTAKVYGAAFDATGKTVRAVGFDETNAKFTSDVATVEVAS